MIRAARRASGAQNSIKPARHICYFHQGATDHFETVSKFLQQGVEKSERALYIFDENENNDPRTTLVYLEEFGLDLSKVEFVSSYETYLRGGVFSAERMLDFIDEALKETHRRGYTGLRGTGEMSWCMKHVPGCETVSDYEIGIDRHFSKRGLMALCQYDVSKISFDVLIANAIIHQRSVGAIDLAEAILCALRSLSNPEECLDNRFKDMNISGEELQDMLEVLLEQKPFQDAVSQQRAKRQIRSNRTTAY